MTDYKLTEKWSTVRELGRGGFGTVFEVTNGSISRALKLIPGVTDGWRDLLVNEIPVGPYAIPILDSGQSGGDGLLLMPLADLSLRDAIEAEAPFAEARAISILNDLAGALSAMESAGVVHRDIKPENILLHDGIWKVSDFGESRYAEATTALSTRRAHMTPEYSAPERWWEERATSRTDVYSWAVIAYELLLGERPFPGPRDRLREQHLTAPPPDLPIENTALASLVKLCLAKAMEARPTSSGLHRRLQSLIAPTTRPGFDALIAASAQIADTMAEESLLESQRRLRDSRYVSLYESAVPLLQDLSQTFTQMILDNAVVATDFGTELGSLQLGSGRLEIRGVRAVQPSVWGDSKPPFDVIAMADIGLRGFIRNTPGIGGRSHSLWYCDVRRQEEFEWFEVCFYSRRVGNRPEQDIVPFAWDLDNDLVNMFLGRDADVQLARPFRPFNYEAVAESASEWAGWLATAAVGPLGSPSNLPEEQPEGSWRRPGQIEASNPPSPRR